MAEAKGSARTLAQTLAIQSQICLPGTVGRILHQIRELEAIAPLFVKAGLVKSVDRPTPLNLKVSGIGTRSTVKRTVGGFVYATAAVRIDLVVENNVVSTAGQDSRCEIDDINFEDQSKTLQLNEARLAYGLAEAALDDFEPDLVLMDCPLALNRSMVPNSGRDIEGQYNQSYSRAVEVIRRFWENKKSSIFPWAENGPVVGGIAAQRFGAIVHSAMADLRDTQGRSQVLSSESTDLRVLETLGPRADSVRGIGERRFVFGLLGGYTRTAAFKMSVHTPRMEPSLLTDLGVLGVHYRAGLHGSPQLLQLIGDETGWGKDSADDVTGKIMALTATGGDRAMPLPIQLAYRELKGLDAFLENYRRGLAEEMRNRRIENAWLEDVDAFDQDN